MAPELGSDDVLERQGGMVFSDSTKGYHKIKTKNHAKHPLQTYKKGVKRTTTST